MTRCRIFISHASSDALLARSLQQFFCENLTISTGQIFCSSNPSSISYSEKFEPQILAAFQNADVVVALWTPLAQGRDWVRAELGGAHFQKGKHLCLILANGCSSRSVPPPFSMWQHCRISDSEQVKNLVLSISKALHLSAKNKLVGYSNLLRKTISVAGEWDLVESALIAPSARSSPFSLYSLLDDTGMFHPSEEIFAIGQNLYFITRAGENQKYFKSKITSWLRKGPKRRVRFLIQKESNTNAVNLWQELMRSDFKEHLRYSRKQLLEWAASAKSQRLSLFVKERELVPVSALFIDPKQPHGFAVIIPVAFKAISEERPHFILFKSRNPATFEYYYNAFDHAWNL